MFCPNCGVENPDTAVECRRCHVPFEEPPADTGGHASLADEQEESTQVEAGMQAAQQEGSESFGTVCRRCEAFNEPGVDRCTNCGYKLTSDDAPAAPAHEAAAPEHEAALDHTPPSPHPISDTANEAPLPDTTPPSGQPSLSDELQALAISDEDARSAQSADQTPPEGVPAMHAEAHHEEPPPEHHEEHHDPTPPPPVRAKAAPPPVHHEEEHHDPTPPPPVRAKPAPAPAPTPPPPAAAAEKICASCEAVNLPNAKFCAECGTPFPKQAPVAAAKAKPAPAPAPVATPPPPVDEEFSTDPSQRKARAPEITSEQAPVSVDAEPPHEQDTAVEEPVDSGPPRHAPQYSTNENERLPSPEDLAAFEAARMAHTGKARVKPPPDEPPAIEVAGDLAAAEEEAPPEEHEHAHEDHAGAAPPEAPPEEESADVVEEAPMEAAPEEAAAEAPPEEAAEAPPEEAPPEEAAEAAVEEAEPVEELAAPIEEPPYPVQLTVERGSSAGTAIALTGLSNILGGNGAGLSLGEDPHLASQHALLFFEDQKLLLRDEGAANGVYVKLRAESQLVPGDLFIAGERLLRFDGPVELTTGTAGDTPLQGAPRPQGTAFKISEVLKGGKVGRTAHRAGPVIAIGKTGCDLNFPADALLGARHAEVHLAEDGSATLHDLGAAPTGVFLRLRPQAAHEVIAGDVLQVGDQTVRVDF